MSLARNVTTVGGATLLSRLLGFLRDMLIAAALGAGALSDAYFAAFALPNLFRRLLAEGALNAAFVPVWLRIRHQQGGEGARRFGESILGLMMLGLGLIALVGVVLAPEVVRMLAPGFTPGSERFILAVDYARLSIPYLAIAGIVAVAASTLNAEGRTGATALGVVTFNLVLIAIVGALGLNILVGWTGQISIGHAAFMSVGAYTAPQTSQESPYWSLAPHLGHSPLM